MSAEEQTPEQRYNAHKENAWTFNSLDNSNHAPAKNLFNIHKSFIADRTLDRAQRDAFKTAFYTKLGNVINQNPVAFFALAKKATAYDSLDRQKFKKMIQNDAFSAVFITCKKAIEEHIPQDNAGKKDYLAGLAFVALRGGKILPGAQAPENPDWLDQNKKHYNVGLTGGQQHWKELLNWHGQKCYELLNPDQQFIQTNMSFASGVATSDRSRPSTEDNIGIARKAESAFAPNWTESDEDSYLYLRKTIEEKKNEPDFKLVVSGYSRGAVSAIRVYNRLIQDISGGTISTTSTADLISKLHLWIHEPVPGPLYKHTQIIEGTPGNVKISYMARRPDPLLAPLLLVDGDWVPAAGANRNELTSRLAAYALRFRAQPTGECHPTMHIEKFGNHSSTGWDFGTNQSLRTFFYQGEINSGNNSHIHYFAGTGCNLSHQNPFLPQQSHIHRPQQNPITVVKAYKGNLAVRRHQREHIGASVGCSLFAAGAGTGGGFSIGALITSSALAMAITPVGLGVLCVGLLVLAAVLAVVAIVQTVKAFDKQKSIKNEVEIPTIQAVT